MSRSPDSGWQRRTVLGAALGMAITGAGGLAAGPAAAVVHPMPDTMLVPAYFSPLFFPAQWPRLADPRLLAVVLNIDNGPGTARLPAFAAAVDAVHHVGGTVVGYIDTAYGDRPAAEVEAEFRAYQDWYGVSDVFLDQVPAAAGSLPALRELCGRLRGRHAEFIVFNHGAYPDPGYADIADLLVTFEGPWHVYQHIRHPAWTMELPARRFCHLVYDTPQAALDPAMRLAGQRNTGVVYVTDGTGDNPWGDLAGYFDQELALLR